MSNSSAAGAMPAAHGPARSIFLRLLPLTLAVFVGFFMIGLPMPVQPLYVDGTLALGAYVAFLDVALGLGSPAAGWLAGLQGYAAVYALGGACALAAMVVGMALRGKA